MELRHLRYFDAVADELNFTRASERLHIAQPPLSQQIRQLEEEIGVTLLDRAERPMRLTDAGREFHKRTKEILELATESINVARRIGRGVTGRLEIGFAGSAMFTVMSDVIREFRTQAPDVELSMHEMLAAEIAESLRKRTIDLGFSRPPLEDTPELKQRLLIEEPFMLAVPSGHPLADKETIELADLRTEPMIMYPRYPLPSLTDLFERACEREGFEPRIVQLASQMQTAIGFVVAGIGSTLVAASVRQQQREGVEFIHITNTSFTYPLTLVWRNERVSVLQQKFLDIAQSVQLEFDREM